MSPFDLMKLNISKITGAVLMMAGILLFLSPELIREIQTVQIKVFITTYEKKYAHGDEDETADPLYQEIAGYNQSIYLDGQSGFSDPWSYEQSPINMDGLEDGVFGYIEIPSMNQTFELYIGATMENMSRGVAIMGGTSLPVGGKNTNCVIAGHRGYNRNKTFFKDIEDIQIGDMVYIRNPWEKLAYMVESVDVVEPYDIDAVRIQEGRDMITLLTCHPYASNGRYRYLVYCIRYEEDGDVKKSKEERDTEIRVEEEFDYSEYIVASDGTAYTSSKHEIEKETLFRRACIGFVLLFMLIALVKKAAGRKKKYKNRN